MFHSLLFTHTCPIHTMHPENAYVPRIDSSFARNLDLTSRSRLMVLRSDNRFVNSHYYGRFEDHLTAVKENRLVISTRYVAFIRLISIARTRSRFSGGKIKISAFWARNLHRENAYSSRLSEKRFEGKRREIMNEP